MATLPERAILDLRKIEDYCLNLDHPRGRHKARVFRDALGLTRSDTSWLRTTLLDALPKSHAVETVSDVYGHRWRGDIAIARQERRAVGRTVWMQPMNEDLLKFVTCWVL